MKATKQAQTSSLIPLSRESFTFRVRKALWIRDLNITQLARRIGFARNTVSRTINHPTIHPKVRRKIERELKLEGAR